MTKLNKISALKAAAFAIASIAAAPVQAQAYLERYIGDMAAAVEQCTVHFPDMSETRRAMRQIGMRHEADVGGQVVYSKHGRNILAVIERQDRNARCIFGVDGLYEGNAEEVLQRLVAENGGQMRGELNARNYQNMESAHAVEMNGRVWFVGITKLVSLGNVYRGSLLVMRELE